MTNTSLKEQLILDLFEINAIKFGEFKLKSGIISPFYFDLRLLVSYPYLLELIADVFWEKLRTIYFDVIVGVPYTAIPIATAICMKQNQSMVMVRKERKEHGTKKMIEGYFHEGQYAIVVDDVITNGESKLLTIEPLEKEELIVKDIIVLLDRGQGGPELMTKHGYRCHSIIHVNEIFEALLRFKKITPAEAKKCLAFVEKTRKQFLKSPRAKLKS